MWLVVVVAFFAFLAVRGLIVLMSAHRQEILAVRISNELHRREEEARQRRAQEEKERKAKEKEAQLARRGIAA